MINLFKISFLFLFAIVFTGCAKYNAKMLTTPSSFTLQEQPVNNGLRIYAKALSKKESKKLLGRDLLAKGFQPVQLFIENHTDNTFLFKKEGISLPLASSEEVAKKVHTSTVGRATGYGAAAILLSPVFALPAIVDGIGSARANDLLDNDYIAKGVKDQTIFPYSYINMILFVPIESYKSIFFVNVFNEKTQSQERLVASIL